MIKRLKRRFILLAMISMALLLSAMVAGINIINYNTVVSEADDKLETLSENGGRLPFYDSFFDDDEMYYNDMDGFGFHRGRPFNSRDEAEETRYFSVLFAADDSVLRIYTDRIFAVDDTSAVEYATKALFTDKDRGFINDYRYLVTDGSNYTRITFLDCGRSLEAFHRFLYASILMAVVGLLVVFVIICYFAGRIVRPVAESYEKQKRFITDAGHEIKTPLAIIKANIDVMKMDMDDIKVCAGVSDSPEAGSSGGDVAGTGSPAKAEVSCADPYEGIRTSVESLTESLEDMDSQVDRLTNLTNDLVYLSRMEESSNALTMTEIPVSDIVSETVDSFGPLAAERSKDLVMEINPGLTMQGSSKEIEKLISILVENALKYSPAEDRIMVSLGKEGKNIILEVSNKAADPLTEEDLAHVFDRFYRADKSRSSVSGGHGIGLSMASAIVAAHGGKIRARSGDGSEFIVTATMPAGK